MQFILSETAKKHILTEKYTLTEATIQDVANRFILEATNDLTTFKGKIDAIYSALKPSAKAAAISAAYEEYLNSKKEADNANKKADLDDAAANELRGELGTFITKVNDLITALDAGPYATDPTYTAGKGRINTNISTLNTKTASAWTTTSTDKTDAVTAYDAINTDIAAFKVANLIGGAIPTETINDLKAQSKELSELTDKLLKAYQAVNVDNFDEADVDALVDKVRNVKTEVKTINGWTVPATITLPGTINTLKVKLPKIKTALVELSETSITSAAEKEAEISTSAKAPWANLYAACKSKEDYEHFWNGDPASADPILKDGYWKAEWGADAKKIKDFNIVGFMDDLQKIGFDEIKNPFLGFVKKHLNDFALTKEHYAILHNALAYGTITLNDFTDKSVFKEYNLVQNKHIYTDIASMADYLKSQNRVRQQSGSLKDDQKIAYDTNPGVFLGNLVLKGGNLADLKKGIAAGGDVFPIDTFNTRIESVYGKADETNKGTVTNKEIDELLAKVTTKDMARKLISFLVTIWMIDYIDVINKVDTANGGVLYTYRTSDVPSRTEIQDFITKIMHLDTKKYTKKQIEDILTKLVAIAA